MYEAGREGRRERREEEERRRMSEREREKRGKEGDKGRGRERGKEVMVVAVFGGIFNIFHSLYLPRRWRSPSSVSPTPTCVK